jgi:hypothetical protein
MDSKQIELLLEKYWKCETSLEEEKVLREYFKQPVVADALKESAILFRYLEQQRQRTLSDVSFEGALKKRMQPTETKMRSLVLNTLRIAAGISVVVASVWLVRTQWQTSEATEITDTYDDPKKAFEETKRALQLISKNFGKAEKATANINLINEAKDKIQKEQKIDS